MDDLIVTAEAWPYGLRCMDCDVAMEEGAPYSKRLVGVLSQPADEAGYPVVEIVCAPCGLGLRSGR